MTKVFVDVNVIVDYVGERRPFFSAASSVIALIRDQAITAHCSSVTVQFAFYHARRLLGSDVGATQASKRIFEIFQLVALDRQLLQDAIDCPIADLEDAVQYISALRSGASVIITRDATGFTAGRLPTMSPQAWLDLNYPPLK